MVKILFDENSSQKRRYSFILDAPTRRQYLSLCSDLLNPEIDGRPVIDSLLKIIADTAHHHISTAIPLSYKLFMNNYMDEIISNIDYSDKNYLALINVVSVQIVILFSYYFLLEGLTDENSHEKWKNYTLNKLEREFGRRTKEYEDFKKTVEYLHVYKFYPILKTGKWVQYNELKNFMERDEDYHNILNSASEKERFIPFIGFLKIQELVDGILNGINYLGLSFQSENADGVYLSPIQYIEHDLNHYIAFKGLFSELDLDDIRHHLRQFRQQLRQKSNITPSILYSIDFILFAILHEEVVGLVDDSFYPILESHDMIMESFADLNRYVDKTDLGLSIPPSYRIPTEDPNIFNEEKVIEYIELSIDRMISAWKEYIEANPLNNTSKFMMRVKQTRKISKRSPKIKKVKKSIKPKKSSRKISIKRVKKVNKSIKAKKASRKKVKKSIKRVKKVDK